MLSWEEDLEAEYPRIPWRRPLRVVVRRVGGPIDRYACRFCLYKGMRDDEIKIDHMTEGEVETHIALVHSS